MNEGPSGWLLDVLRVPQEPRLPVGEPGSARVFRAGANFWRLRVVEWSAKQAAVLFGFASFMAVAHWAPHAIPYLPLVRTVETMLLGFWLLQLPITFAILHLDYRLRWYIVTDRAARLREGIVRLREMTFTLANVQDIRIRQGPLQRALGLADLELRTAGGSEALPGAHGRNAGENLHLARFRGVANAEAIRDLVVDRMKKARGAGLGDPDDAPAPTARPLPESIAAAALELAQEARRLREAATRFAQG